MTPAETDGRSFDGGLLLVQLKRFLASSRPTFLKKHEQKSLVSETRQSSISTPGDIAPLDLWAIHDLLVIGHKGPLIEENVGRSQVEAAANALGGLLQYVHPVPACRKALADSADAALFKKAEASWSCLGLSAANFSGAMTSESTGFYAAANTEPKFNELLSACKGSKWPRACSYWSAFHAMGVRADAMNKAREYFDAILRIISGGALYCFGCTSHWRILNEYLLPAELRDSNGLVSY